MAASASKLEKQKNKLVEAGLMSQEDTLVDFFQANYVEHLTKRMGTWKQGWVYFTEKRLIVITGLLNSNIVIPYSEITQLEKCSQSLIPMGIAITHKDAESGALVTDKISLMKRVKWMEFMAQRAGITLV